MMENGWTKRILIWHHSLRLIAESSAARQATPVSAAIGNLYPRLERVDGHSGALRLLC